MESPKRELCNWTCATTPDDSIDKFTGINDWHPLNDRYNWEDAEKQGYKVVQIEVRKKGGE